MGCQGAEGDMVEVLKDYKKTDGDNGPRRPSRVLSVAGSIACMHACMHIRCHADPKRGR